jgi:hypothetical protein
MGVLKGKSVMNVPIRGTDSIGQECHERSDPGGKFDKQKCHERSDPADKSDKQKCHERSDPADKFDHR